MVQPVSQPRTRCRLPCTVTKGRKRIRAKLLDVSEGGLCIVTPVRFEHQSTIQVVIDVPRQGPVAVEGIVWHARPFRQPSSGRRGWATGLVLAKAGPGFLAIAKPDGALLQPGGNALEALAPTPPEEQAIAESRPPEVEVQVAKVAGRAQVFRVRLKAVGSNRTRVLILNAASEAAVREAVVTDLPGDWEIIGVEADPFG